MQLIVTDVAGLVNQFLIPLAHGIIPPDLIVPSSLAGVLGIPASHTGFIRLSAQGGLFPVTTTISTVLNNQ